MPAATVEQELIDLEKQYWQAIKDKNADVAMRLSDDPCIVTGAQGVGRIARRTLAGMMKSASFRLHDFQLRDVHVQLVTNDVAILAYRVYEQLTVDGRPVTLEASDASTWVRRDGRWQCALHTESLAGDPFGRDRHSK